MAKSRKDTGSDAVATAERPPSAVVEAVKALEAQGRSDPKNVLEEARDPDSPLHACFEWDDGVAGEAFRLDQARRLIRRVRMEIVYEDEIRIVPRYLRDPEQDNDDTGYVSVDQARKEPQSIEKIMAYETERVLGLLDRLGNIAASLGRDEMVKACARCAAALRKAGV